jgi:hypothetical protein
VTISHHRALRRKILTTVMGAPQQILPERNSDRGDIMPANISTRLGGSILVLVLAFLLLAESPAFAQTVRYELFPEPDVRQAATNRTASAYVVDKQGQPILDLHGAIRFFATGRLIMGIASSFHSISEDLRSPKTTTPKSTQVNAYLPVIWFIEPAIGAVQFCAVPTQGRTSGLRCPDRTHRKGRPCRRCY